LFGRSHVSYNNKKEKEKKEKKETKEKRKMKKRKRKNFFITIRYIALPSIETKGLEVVLDVAPNIPARIIADPARVRQVALNLLSNATKVLLL
jgi:signal transduction histidine kinase